MCVFININSQLYVELFFENSRMIKS